MPELKPDDVEVRPPSRFYIDCEFDGHGGPLLSMAIVPESGLGLHYRVRDTEARDPWVIENVVPLMAEHHATESHCGALHSVGWALRRFIGECRNPIIIADSPVDIGRFCTAISTDENGGWASTEYLGMTFEVHNVDCYPTDLPGARQHNAWWDAMALRHKLATRPDPLRDEIVEVVRPFAVAADQIDQQAKFTGGGIAGSPETLARVEQLRAARTLLAKLEGRDG